MWYGKWYGSLEAPLEFFQEPLLEASISEAVGMAKARQWIEDLGFMEGYPKLAKPKHVLSPTKIQWSHEKKKSDTFHEILVG